MIRKLLLPLVAVALLGGCVTSGYGYRPHGGGSYYYGGPSVDYRYYSPYGSYYGGAYGYYGQPYGYGYGYSYGYPYGYTPYYYGNQYYYYYGQPRVYYYPRPVERPQVDPRPDSDVSPWRDLERLRARVRGDRMPSGTTQPSAPQVETGPSYRRAREPMRMIQPTMPQVDSGLSSGRYSQRRRPASVGTSIPMPQPRISVSPPQPRSAPAPRSDGSALGGSARRMRKGDVTTETAP